VRMAYSAFSISFLNIFIARDAGFFRKHSLDVELIQMAGPLPIAAMIAGHVDYLTGFTIGLVAAGRGVPLRGIMVTLRKPPFFWFRNRPFRSRRIYLESASALIGSAVSSISSLV
jgi:ABC-type nitrate/sulfonate/bicarbonate transport system substrate-binding protein